MAGEHFHAEAFKLMKYRCRTCKHELVIWNSRDGVTPFNIQCRSCATLGGMTHVDWQNDRYEPEYQPRPGELVFVDPSKSEIKKRLRRGMNKAHAREHPVLRKW